MRTTRRRLGALALGGALLPGTAWTAEGQAAAARGRLHIRRYAPALASDGRSAIISGGAPIGAGRTDEHFHSSLLGVVEHIDPHTLAQTFRANAIHARANHASVWLNGRLWLLGGRTRDGTEGRHVHETEQIDLDTQAIWRGPDLPLPLIHPTAVRLGDSVFLIGGESRPPGERTPVVSARVFECAPPHERWIERAAMPIGLGNAGAVVLEGRIHLVGGYDRTRARAVMQVFDPETNRWSFGPPPPLPLSAHAVAEAAGAIYVFGDYSAQETVLGYRPEQGWRRLEVPFLPRRHVRATRVRDHIVVAGGNQTSVAPATDALESYPLELLAAAYESAPPAASVPG